MADYIISNGELHNMDELKHAKFKYLYKKKVNGKWRYYYEGDSMDAGKKRMEYYHYTIKIDPVNTERI